MDKVTNRRALGFFAHPDDAEFLATGTMMRLAEAGWEIHIATAAPGDCGTMTEDRWAISGRRTAEARRAAQSIGATYHCIDERDGFVVYDKTALQKTYDLFRRIAPALVFTHALRDYMMDHEQAALLARAASFLYGAPNISSHAVAAGSCVPHLYYCDPMEARDAVSGQVVKPTTYVDVTAQLERKVEMLACHASQRDWLMAHHGMDEYTEMLRRHMALRGREISVAAAEAFVQHLGHPYPQDDLLGRLFSG